MDLLTLRHLLLILAAGAALLQERRARGLAASATAAAALGVVALGVTLGTGATRPLSLALALAGLPPTFLAGTAGLFLVAGLLAVGAVGFACAARRPLDLAGALLIVGSGTVLGWQVLPLAETGIRSALLAAGAVLAAAVVLYWAGRFLMLGLALRWLDERVLAARPPRARGWASGDAVAAAVAVLGVGLTLLASRLELVLGGAGLAAVGGHIAARRRGRASVVPVLPILALLSLAPAGWLMAVIARPTGLGLSALPAGPFSPAAQEILVGLLVLGAWGFFGIWPLRHWVPGIVLAPVGGALLLRIAVPALPSGVEHWQALMVPAALVGMWVAVALRRPALGLPAAAVMGIAAGAGGGPAGAWWLVAASAVCGAWWWLDRTPRWPAVLGRIAWLVPVWGGLLVLDGLLRTQVVYAVLATGAVAAAAWSAPARLRVTPPHGEPQR